MKVSFQILYYLGGVGNVTHIEWSRRTTELVSLCEFGSDTAIAAAERHDPNMPAEVNTDVADLCDATVADWGDFAAASAIGLLWCIARLALACTGADGKARLTITRGGMTITCDTIPG